MGGGGEALKLLQILDLCLCFTIKLSGTIIGNFYALPGQLQFNKCSSLKVQSI